MSSSPSETAAHPLEELAGAVASAVGGAAEMQFGTAKVKIPAAGWVDAHLEARDQFDLVFFSWLSAIHWANDVAAGEPLAEEVEERIELMSALSDLAEGRLVVFSTDLDAGQPRIPTLVDVFAGANWHEREAFEMFGIVFEGHPNLIHLYLPDSFVGNPLRKSFPLLSREVKPWPGTVDVEGMPSQDGEEEPAAESTDEPSTENPEA